MVTIINKNELPRHDVVSMCLLLAAALEKGQECTDIIFLSKLIYYFNNIILIILKWWSFLAVTGKRHVFGIKAIFFKFIFKVPLLKVLEQVEYYRWHTAGSTTGFTDLQAHQSLDKQLFCQMFEFFFFSGSKPVWRWTATCCAHHVSRKGKIQVHFI